MKIVYMGTPDFAVPPLEMLARNGQDVCLVVTKPDAPQKRGKKVLASPVKNKAIELGIPVSQPENIKGNLDFFNMIKAMSPDLIVVAAYGKILPVDILNIPPLGSINIHASLLPKFRGAAPIHRSIEAGESETGITLMYMSEGLDEGDIIASLKTDIDSKNTGELHDELAEMGAKLLESKLGDIEENRITRIPQDGELANYAHMLKKEDGHVDFTKDGIIIERLIRAMTPFPGAFALINDKKMKIIKAVIEKHKGNQNPGEIIRVDDEGILVKSGDENAILIKLIQMPGKKAMDVASYLRGNKIETGQILK